MGRHIEVLTWVEEGEGDDGKVKWYKQWLPAVVMAMSDGTEAYKTADKSGRLRQQLKGWFKLEYDDGYVEWSKLRTFNCNSAGSWRLDLDYEGLGEDEDSEDESEEGDDFEDEESNEMNGEDE